MGTLLLRDEPTVFLIDRDPQTLKALQHIATSVPLRLERYSASEDFFCAADAERSGCLLVDLHLPCLGGLAMFDRFAERRIHLPVVVLAEHADIATAVAAMKAGAIDFLQKPCCAEQIERSLREAFHWDAQHRRDLVLGIKARRRMAHLTPGEREVLRLLVEGLSNRETAVELDRSVRAVEDRRAKLMEKMKAKTVAELVRLVSAARYYGGCCV